MKKKGLLVVLLALVLATAGVAYAAWTATLTTTANVSTGTLMVGWADGAYTDDPAGNNDPKNEIRCTGGVCQYLRGAIERYAKDVGVCTVARSGTNGEILTITIGNAYPSYHCSIFADAKNWGSIPLMADGTGTFSFTRTISGVGTDTGIVAPTQYEASHDQTYCTAHPYECPQGVYFDGNPLGSPDIMFDVAKGISPLTPALDAGATAEVRIWFHVQPEAEQGATYTMAMTQNFVPFNTTP
jgi:hypothetical protein